jgi:uncharacterized SAM-binding protein YcdF (DUF218 family)
VTDQEITDLLFVDDGPERADLALVFGYADPVGARLRARHAARLYREGYVPKLLLSGGKSGRGDPRSEAELMLRVVADSGVPREAILVEDRSRTTFENVTNSISLLNDLGEIDAIGTVLLVSCPWHTRRASLIAREGFPAGTRLRCCPHADSCTAKSWRSSPGCRRRVMGEARLLCSFIEAGILPYPSI